jgi:molybdate transport system substrate-binding protein
VRTGLRSILAALAIALVATACGEPVAPPARVFAAASLTAAFTDLAAEFAKSAAGGRVELHFAGTPQLVVQLREGAEADVFASADQPNLQKVLALGGAAGAPTVFATNRLCLVVAKGNPRRITGLADLARADLAVLLCGPEVPAGRYAREALAKAGVTAVSRSDEPSVKAVVAKVGLGEADVGIVYATDAAAAQGRLAEVAIPAEHNVVASYPIVALTRGAAPATGAAFVAFVGSPAGRAVLARHGFGAP